MSSDRLHEVLSSIDGPYDDLLPHMTKSERARYCAKIRRKAYFYSNRIGIAEPLRWHKEAIEIAQKVLKRIAHPDWMPSNWYYLVFRQGRC